jgi:hypothetical protein
MHQGADHRCLAVDGETRPKEQQAGKQEMAVTGQPWHNLEASSWRFRGQGVHQVAKDKRRSSGGDTPVMMPDGKSQHAKPVRWVLIVAVVLALMVLAAGVLYLYSDHAFAGLRGFFGGGFQP